ncbi:E3 ubiquitin-protein ligase RNF4 [Heracleum sosnowskyi]|uniref:E3 ubiquitin-protein ligase RNF4 n=1 Tax=Heracleum sosnowskyi TaxID=360622 RepID=A0AAD8GRU7_9APIA|nr:E3 ubiquitin-protein ligase RNF4 [Heracleum sosnowskyi]
MSARESKSPVTYARSSSRRRKRPLEVDLNVPPPTENREQGEIATDAAESHVGPSAQQRSSITPPPIDLEALDDDVIISSPRAFAEAKNKAGRPRGRAIRVDVDLSISDGPSSRAARSKRGRGSTNQTIFDGNLFINLEGNGNSMRDNVASVSPVVPPPPPPPKELVFTCPICMSSIVEEMTTKCGHIFCKNCIKAALAVRNQCPTCRKKISMKDTHRVYLPRSS